jgi:hypothetical protein
MASTTQASTPASSVTLIINIHPHNFYYEFKNIDPNQNLRLYLEKVAASMNPDKTAMVYYSMTVYNQVTKSVQEFQSLQNPRAMGYTSGMMKIRFHYPLYKQAEEKMQEDEWLKDLHNVSNGLNDLVIPLD